MTLRVVAISLALIPAISSAASFYVYPERVELDLSCELSAETIEALEARWSDESAGARGVARASAVDLNHDSQCEIFLDVPAIYEGNGNAFTVFLLERGGEYVDAGSIQWGPRMWWYGEFQNGYPRILVQTYSGHRTNPHYVTDVYAFDGKKYLIEFDSSATHGYYMDQGLRAYRSSNYDLAERYYRNAYRMRKELHLSDANNLALALFRLGRMNEAKAMLEDHLAAGPSGDQAAAAYFNLGLIEEQVGDYEVALRHYERANGLKPTQARQEKVRELKGPANP